MGLSFRSQSRVSVGGWLLVCLSGCSAWVHPDPDRSFTPIDAGQDATVSFDLGPEDQGVVNDASSAFDTGTARDMGAFSDASIGDGGSDARVDGGPDSGGPIGLPDTCPDAQEILLRDGVGVARGSFGDFSFNYSLPISCVPAASARGGNGRDAVYVITVNNVVDVAIDTFGTDAGVDPVLSVGQPNGACGAFDLACYDDLSTTPRIDRQSRIWLHRVGATRTPTRIYILVSGYNASATGSFVVNVHVTDPAAQDTCPVGLASPLDVTNGGLLVGFAHSGSGSGMTLSRNCGRGAGTPEALVSFRPFTDAPSSSVQFTAVGRDFAPVLYARTSCADIGSELACQPNSMTMPTNTVSLSVAPDMSSARRFVFVDNLPNRETTFTLRVTTQ